MENDYKNYDTIFISVLNIMTLKKKKLKPHRTCEAHVMKLVCVCVYIYSDII